MASQPGSENFGHDIVDTHERKKLLLLRGWMGMFVGAVLIVWEQT
jgi:hypothetical protein